MKKIGYSETDQAGSTRELALMVFDDDVTTEKLIEILGEWKEALEQK